MRPLPDRNVLKLATQVAAAEWLKSAFLWVYSTGSAMRPQLKERSTRSAGMRQVIFAALAIIVGVSAVILFDQLRDRAPPPPAAQPKTTADASIGTISFASEKDCRQLRLDNRTGNVERVAADCKDGMPESKDQTREPPSGKRLNSVRDSFVGR
jgi:hypothetical protein